MLGDDECVNFSRTEPFTAVTIDAARDVPGAKIGRR